MDPKKTALVAKAFREAAIDVQDVPETMALLVCAFAREVSKVSDPRDADTLIFMTMDQLLTRWQGMRSTEAPIECMHCLEDGQHVPADFWVIVKASNGTDFDRVSCCDSHAAKRRDAIRSATPNANPHLERIRR